MGANVKQHRYPSLRSDGSDLTIDDPTSPPRPHISTSQTKDTSATSPTPQASNDTKKRSRSSRLLSALRKNRSLKGKAVVGAPTISNVPANITRRTPALNIIVETELEAVEAQPDTQPETLEQVTSKHTTNTESPLGQHGQDHTEDHGIQKHEETPPSEDGSLTDTMHNKQLVLVCFFDASLLQELKFIRILPEVPAILAAGLVKLSPDTVNRIHVERATHLYRCDTSLTYAPTAQRLDAQTGALVLYRPKPSQRSSHQLLQAVEELSEHREPIEAWSFEEEYHTEPSSKFLMDVGCIVSPNEMSHTTDPPEELAELNDGEDGKDSEISSVHSASSVDEKQISVQRSNITTIGDKDREILRLKAEHRAEVTKLKNQNRENIQIFADDLAEQKQKTINANQRAARSVKQLNASRKERQNLGEREPVDILHARIAELDEQVKQRDADFDILLGEGTKLQRKVQEQQQTVESLHGELEKALAFRTERDQLLTRCQRLMRDEVNPRQDLIDRLEAQVNGLSHQMRQSVKGYQDLYANYSDVSERLERQKVLNRALSEQRVTRFIERPTSREDWNVLRPDELADAQQALLVSQDNHHKVVSHSGQLIKEIESKAEALEHVTEQFRTAQNKVKALRSCKALTTDVRKAYENSFLAFAAEDASDDSPELKSAAREVIAKEQAMTQKLVDLAVENVSLGKTIATMKKDHLKALALKEVENAARLRKVSDIDVEAFNNEIKVVNLREQVDDLSTQVERGEQQLTISNEFAEGYRAQLEHRAYGGDYDFVIRMLKGELSQANNTIDSQQEDMIQQQYHIDELHANMGQLNLMIDRTRPFRLWRNRFYQDEATIGAFRDRFAQELAAKPLEVDYNSLTIPTETDEEKAELDFDEYEWMTVHEGSDWEHKHFVEPQSQGLTAAYAEMVAAVKAQAASRREVGFDEMVGIGLQDELREEIEREVVEHQAANTIEVANASLIDDIVDQNTTTSRDAEPTDNQESSVIPSTTEGTLVDTMVGNGDHQKSQDSFLWDRDTF